MRAALRGWTFSPAEWNGRAVSDWVVVPLRIVR